MSNLQILHVLWSRFLAPPERDRFFVARTSSSGPSHDGRRMGGVGGLTWAHNGKGAAQQRAALPMAAIPEWTKMSRHQFYRP